jgi:hypothetical protein
MAKIQIPLKFKQIAIDNFLSIPDDAPIIPIIKIAGTDKGIDIGAIKTALQWLESDGESLELKDGVTPGKGLRRLKSCLENGLAQSLEKRIAQSQPPKKKANP